MELFVCATNVRTGKLRVFGPDEVSRDAVLASACLPALFHAVEIEGEHYWDGGYGSNPPVLPLVQGTDCGDTVIVQIDPVRIDELPVTARARRIAGRLRGNAPVRLHLIEAEASMAHLSAASKLDAHETFLQELFVLGRAQADAFLDEHKAALGRRSSFDVTARFL